MRKLFLDWLGNSISNRPGIFLSITLLITLFLGWRTSYLTLDSNFTSLMPAGDPMVEEFNKVNEDFAGSASMIIVAEGDPVKLIQFAETVTPEIEEMTDLFEKVDYQLPMDLMSEHALMLMKSEDLQQNIAFFSEPNLTDFLSNLNDTFEKEYTGSGGGSLENQEEEAIRFMDGIQTFVDDLSSAIEDNNQNLGKNAAEALLLGDKYYRSWDRRMLMMTIIPKFHFLDMHSDTLATNKVEKIIKRVASDLNIEAGLTGMVPLQRDEVVAITNDSFTITIVALLLILALFIIAFRMFLSPVFAIATLITGIIWALGLVQILIGSLNIMTSMMGVILVGLGIDFSIHIIAVYTELRGQQLSPEEALKRTLFTSGNGILTGGLTTSAAFFTFIVSSTEGFREFGWALGAGILMTMLAAISFLPSILVLQDKIKDYISKSNSKPKMPKALGYEKLGNFAHTLSKFPSFTLTGFIFITLVLFYRGKNIGWDYNYLNMEPEGLESIILQNKLLEKLDISGDYAFVTASTLSEAHVLTEKARDMKTSGIVRSITDFLPPENEQIERSKIVREIQGNISNSKINSSFTDLDRSRLIEELSRLEMNIMEIQDMANIGDQANVYRKTGLLVGVVPENEDSTVMAWQRSLSEINDDISTGLLSNLINRMNTNSPDDLENLAGFHNSFSKGFKNLTLKMANPEKLTLATIPETIRDQYVGKSTGQYLIMVYPNSNVWDYEFLPRFTNELYSVSTRATGLPPVFLRLMDLMGRDGVKATSFALVIIFIVLLLDFRNVKKALLAIVPLIAGSLWMLGVMELSSLQITMVNVMAIPLIIGIGVDDGIHVVHRYEIEGFHNHRKVFSSTGRAILLTSLTTMLGFGSLTFATYRGLGSMGIAMFIGVGTCFLATVLGMPALIKVLFKKDQ